jgi:type II secretory pathway component GspD/PulD (secretin)
MQNIKTHWRLLILILLGSAVTYGAFAALRARSNLVSLNVRDADVRSVVRQLKWQTWEDICLAPEVQGRVTLNVHKLPLEDVLRIIGQQTLSRSTAVYPLYSSRASLRQFKEVVRGEVPADRSHWKAWKAHAFPDFGRFANALRDQNQWVNAQFREKDIEFAALALSRFSRAQVIPEDGIIGTVSLQVSQATLPEAVAQVARQVHRKWTVFYVLSPGLFGTRANLPDPRDSNAVTMSLGLVPGGLTTNLAPEAQAALDRQFEARLATLSPAESNRAVQVRERSDLLRSLPLDQRLQAIQQLMANPEAQNRVRDRVMDRIHAGIKDATPEQRVQGTRALKELQRQFQTPAKGANP